MISFISATFYILTFPDLPTPFKITPLGAPTKSQISTNSLKLNFLTSRQINTVAINRSKKIYESQVIDKLVVQFLIEEFMSKYS